MTILDPETGVSATIEDDLQAVSEEAPIPAAVQKHPTLFQLRSGQCRFPVGGLKEPAQFFCGKPALAPRPYCRECCQRAYVPAKKR
jgi:hypothetical protein